MKRSPTCMRLAELFELEEDAYRLASREARLLDGSPPEASLRTIVAHASEALDALPSLARARCARLGSPRELLVDTLHRLRDIVVTRMEDKEHGYRRVLAVLHEGIDVARLLAAGAREEGDGELAAWCDRWLATRETLVAEASRELEWLGRHPFFASVALGAAMPAMP